MRLLIQPEDGVRPLLDAIRGARRRLDLYVFRLDRDDIERALRDAVRRGVAVRALVARSGRGGVRALEQRLRRAGVTVARTHDDLARYHGKMMIVDRATLYVLGYNLTHQDIERSRSLGVVTTQHELVQEAMRLFQADFERARYTPQHPQFVVSPLNARAVLTRLIAGARRQLLIYDDRLTDRAMIQLLRERAKAGVDVRILGTHGQEAGAAAPAQAAGLEAARARDRAGRPPRLRGQPEPAPPGAGWAARGRPRHRECGRGGPDPPRLRLGLGARRPREDEAGGPSVRHRHAGTKPLHTGVCRC